MSEKKANITKFRGQVLNLGGIIVRGFKNESLIYFGENGLDNDVKVFGVGTVIKIEHGERFDLVMMRFGTIIRKIYVTQPNARKQIYTLKRNQLAQYLGRYKKYRTKRGLAYTMVALGFQGWFTPTQFDVVHTESDVEAFTEEDYDEGVNILDNLVMTE